MTDLKRLTPSARTLYWYLEATGHEQPVPLIEKRSGMPQSSIYDAAARFPELFQLTGSLLKSRPRESPITDYDPNTPN